MKPLRTNQRVLMWLCGVPPNESDSKRKKTAFVTLTLSVIIGHLFLVVAGAVFIYRNVSDNLEEALFSLFHTLPTASMLYQSVVTVFLCRELAGIFEELSDIYNTSDYELNIFLFIRILSEVKNIQLFFTLVYNLIQFKFRQERRFVSHPD